MLVSGVIMSTCNFAFNYIWRTFTLYISCSKSSTAYMKNDQTLINTCRQNLITMYKHN